jgi:hypothetical protein
VGYAVEDMRNSSKIILRKFGKERPFGGEY